MSRLMKRLFLPGPAGRLEALLLQPEQSRAAALLCHPHPQQGGTMHTKVVYRAARGLGEAGCNVLRFNFRGVGHSDGSWGEERGERDDAVAALDWLAQQHPAQPLLVGGFSFGSFMGLQAGIAHSRTTGLVGIGLPVLRYRFDFLRQRRLPLLLLCGSEDPFCPPDALERLAHDLGPQVEIHVLPGEGHLLLGGLDAVQRLLTDFGRRLLGTPLD